MNIRDRIKELRRVRAGDLRPHPKNWRTHPEEQQNALRGILAEVGYVDALMVRELPDGSLQIVDGHLRAETTPDAIVPVLVVDLDDKEADKVLATFDPLAAMAEPDEEQLAALLKGIETDSEALAAMLEQLAQDAGCEPNGEIIEDEIPEPPDEAITKLGDFIILGDHRLLCGDSTDAAQVERLINRKSVRMLFTDPPWNVGIGQDSNPRHRQRPGLRNDRLPAEQFQQFLDAFIAVARSVVEGDVYCILGASEWPRLDASLRAAGFHWSATIIWVKDTFVLGRSKFHRRYEPIWYGWHRDARSSFTERRDLDDVWEIVRPKRSEEHPTMKPVELAARAIQYSSRPGENVLDLFGGSGSTLMAAEQTGRKAFLMELDPPYCDVIVERYEKFTGKKAERIAREVRS